MTVDRFSDVRSGAAAAWRAPTRRLVAHYYGAWLAWLAADGRLDTDQAMEKRATLENLEAYLGEIRAAGLSDHSQAGRLESLHSALRVMGADADSIAPIRRAAYRIRATATPVRPIRPRLRNPLDVLDLSEALLAPLEGSANLPPVAQARRFRDGLILGLWVFRALRLSNLAGIEIGRNLVSTKAGYELQYAPAEMKGNRSFVCEWPRALLGPLRVYLEHHRPVLQGARSTDAIPGLWLSQGGGVLVAGSVAHIIRTRTEEAFGEPMNTHLMRHMLGTTVAEAMPQHVTDVAAMLAHNGLEIAEAHYIHAGSLRAAERYHAVLIERIERASQSMKTAASPRRV